MSALTHTHVHECTTEPAAVAVKKVPELLVTTLMLPLLQLLLPMAVHMGRISRAMA
jgi:hypothetical protein